MANAIATPTITGQWWDGKRQHVIGTVAVTTDNYVQNGIVMSFAGVGVLGSSQPPRICFVNGLAGFTYQFSPGTTQANGLLLVFVQATASTNTPQGQFTTAAMTAVAADTISFYAIFKAR